MKKVFNFRPIFLVFCGVFIGAFFSLDFLCSSLWVKILVLSIILLCALLSFLPFNWFKLRRLATLIFVASVCVGFLFSYLRVEIYNSSIINQTITVKAVVTDKIKQTENGYVSLVLRDVEADLDINGSMVLYVSNASASYFSAGDKIEFLGYVRTRNLLGEDGGVNAKYDANGQKYYCYVSYDDITISHGEPNIFEKIRISGRQSILKACGDCEEGEMLYSVLFGDKTYIDYSFTQKFSRAGTAHLLAVSGLHIGFIVALLILLCNAFKAKPWVKLLVVGLILGGYMFICGFSVSVVRATIMSLVLLGASVIGKQYDGLTSLGVAGLIILFFKPLYALDLGFQLSFGSVLGIMCFSRLFTMALCKCKFPRKVADAMAITLASYVGTLPFTLNAFGELSWIGVISNILLVPLFGIIFSVAFIVMLICLAMPFLSAIYVPIRWFTFAFIKLVDLFAWFSPIVVLGFGAFTIIYVVIMISISKFSFLSKTIKIVGSSLLVVVFSISAIIPLIPNYFVSGIYTAGSSGFLLATSKDSAVYITGSLAKDEAEEVFDNLNANRLKRWVNEIVIIGEPSSYVINFALDNPQVNIYYFSKETSMLKGISNVKHVERSALIANDKIEVSPILVNNQLVMVTAYIDDYGIAFVDSLTTKQVTAVNGMYLQFDLWVFNEYNSKISTFDSKVICDITSYENKNLITTSSDFGLAMDIRRKIV